MPHQAMPHQGMPHQGMPHPGMPHPGTPDQGTPDLADAPPGRRPTLAGGAIGMAVAGLGLLQAQRLVGGNDVELALGREVLLDLGAPQCLSLELRRSPGCLSGHARWELVRLPRRASSGPLSLLFEAAGDLLGADAILEPFAHPLCLEATCACGARVAATGTRWAPAPACPSCGAETTWNSSAQVARLSADAARQLGIADASLQALGLPEAGALISARAGGRCIHLLLDQE
jgi:hypothetical protein